MNGWLLQLNNRIRALVPGKGLIVGAPWFWLALFFVLPFLFVLKISLAEPQLAQPPYQDWIREIEDGLITIKLNFGNYAMLWEDELYRDALWGSFEIAAISTFFCLLIGYPMAYAIALAPTHWRMPLLMLVILPFWTSFLIRVYSWMGILSNEGYLNQFLLGIGVISEPLQILNTNTAVYIGIVYTYLPFMILPIYATLERMDESLLEAAEDLGCSRFSAFWLITFPLSRSGIIAGSFLVFIPALGEFVIPSLLGGSGTLMIGKVLWEEFFSNRDWPVASAVAIILLLILVIPIILFQKNQQRQQEAEA